jgi:hypothetical protein
MAGDPELPTVHPDVDEAVAYYRAFMEEIKMRLGAIKAVVDILRAEPKRPDAFMQAEFAFLQFRLSCELMTLAILAAHRPYGLSDDLMTSWNTELALLELSRTNPQAFPRHVIINRSDAGIQLNVDSKGHLTKRGLVRHYKKCARVLHRGHLRHALEQKAKVYDMDALDRWAKRFGALLSHHVLMVLSEGLVLVVHLTGGENGSVSVAIAQADGSAVLVEHEDGTLSGFREGEQPPPV